MNTFKHQAAQGDMLITRIDALPVGLKKLHPEDGHFVVAHSETGHNHVVKAEGVEAFYPSNDNNQFNRDFTLYLVVENKATVEHLRSFDTHAPISLDPGIYRINRQREYIPEGYRRAAD